MKTMKREENGEKLHISSQEKPHKGGGYSHQGDGRRKKPRVLNFFLERG
jgi:hypothetical protein